MNPDKFERVLVKSASELREWLEHHHEQAESVWLVTYKVSVPEFYVGRWEVLDELLCFGWIDGARKKIEEPFTMQLISPRRVNHWAQTYKDRANRLISQGRMHEAGYRSIEISKQQGLWEEMRDVDDLVIPEDLQLALRATRVAERWFTECAPSYRRNVLRWLKLAKTAPTRQARIAKIIETAERGEKIKHL